MNKEYETYLKAHIDLSALKNNLKIIRSKFPNSKIILPVKANAYGHDDIIISKEAEKFGIEYLAVARTSEGINLKKNKIRLPIMNLGVELGENITVAIKNNIELSVSSFDNVKQIENISKKLKQISPVHLKIDTGMSRLGCYNTECEKMANFIFRSKHLKLKSIYTHIAKS
jgi:alanine racemase